MKVLVVGSGAREHAIVHALSLSPEVSELHAIPGNPGMNTKAICHNIDLNSEEELNTFITQHPIELAVIGPEAHLVTGLVDRLRALNVLAFGPSKEASQLEASKVYAKEFMQAAGVPTAEYKIVTSVKSCLSEATNFKPPYVFKVDGLAAGKGVSICKDLSELEKAATDCFEDKIFGAAGDKALLEQYEEGWELSFHILTNGESYAALPLSQDHKRLLDGDEGPNTGGMGVVGPLSVEDTLMENLHKNILEPSIRQMKKNSLDYRGVLYVGVMVTSSGPKVIEYNVRFGDPETQVMLPLLDGDWLPVFKSVATGEVPVLEWKPLHIACVVLAAENYPTSPVKGTSIEGDVYFDTASSYFLHAGTKKEGDSWVTNGGRVMNAVGVGSDLKEAIDHAYYQANSIHWKNKQVRRDIGAKILNS